MFWLLTIIPAFVGNYLVLHGLVIYLFPAQCASIRLQREARGFRMMMTGASMVLITTLSTLFTTI